MHKSWEVIQYIFKNIVCPVIKNLILPVISGIVLAILFFLVREKCYPFPNVDGRWNVEMQTEKTLFRPYENMTVKYVAILLREGALIKGTAEKTYEATSADTIEYIGDKRTHGRIEGVIDKHYFSADLAKIYIIEEGERRPFTHFHFLTVGSSDSIGVKTFVRNLCECLIRSSFPERSDSSMVGDFMQTAAESEGEVRWLRNNERSDEGVQR